MPKKNWTAAEKKAFVAQMARGKAAKAKKGGKGKSAPRKKNPGNYGKIDWMDAAKNLGGVAAGAYVGYAVADFIGDLVISKLPANVQGIGYALGGAGVIIAGHMLGKEVGKDWPVAPAFAAIAAPFALRTFASYNMMPLGVEPVGEMSGMGFFGRRRKIAGRRRKQMRGTLARNPMQGSFARNPMQGSMISPSPLMGGSIQPSISIPQLRGGHGGTL